MQAQPATMTATSADMSNVTIVADSRLRSEKRKYKKSQYTVSTIAGMTMAPNSSRRVFFTMNTRDETWTLFLLRLCRRARDENQRFRIERTQIRRGGRLAVAAHDDDAVR